MEFWSFGVEYGVLELWSCGIVEFWSCGVWSFEVLELNIYIYIYIYIYITRSDPKYL